MYSSTATLSTSDQLNEVDVRFTCSIGWERIKAPTNPPDQSIILGWVFPTATRGYNERHITMHIGGLIWRNVIDGTP